MKHETPWFKKLNLKPGNGSETRKLKCPLCPKEYGTKALIYRHLVDSHFYAQVLLDPRMVNSHTIHSSGIKDLLLFVMVI